jgi:lipopolysaccharide/colanic/teichoic acid biosynthesis glycosyltransferase
MGHEIFLALLMGIITDLCLDWSTNLSHWLARRAVAGVPRRHRDRWLEEWLADIDRRPRVLRLLLALDLFRAAAKLRLDYHSIARHRRGYARLSTNLLAAAMKRAFDIVVASFLLWLIGPCMLVSALAIRINSPGRIFIRLRRVAPDGRAFSIYKFRTVYTDYLDRPFSDRVTRVGAFLRLSSLDELPQLLNVLQGSMSLVGPPARHPAMHEELMKSGIGYGSDLRGVKPGLTGWAQMNEDYMIDEKTLRKGIAQDKAYVRRWSPIVDLRILTRALERSILQRIWPPRD